MVLSRSCRHECVNSTSVFRHGKRLLQKSDKSASHHIYACPSQLQGRHQELARIIDRIIEIGLRGGMAELQIDTPLQPPHIHSDLPLPVSSSAPYVNAECTHPERQP